MCKAFKIVAKYNDCTKGHVESDMTGFPIEDRCSQYTAGKNTGRSITSGSGTMLGGFMFPTVCPQ